MRAIARREETRMRALDENLGKAQRIKKKKADIWNKFQSEYKEIIDSEQD